MWSTSEKLMLREALNKWINTIQLQIDVLVGLDAQLAIMLD